MSRRQFKIVICPLADNEHRKSVRQYAHTFDATQRPGVICVARAFFDLPIEVQDGLLGHEVGHLLAGPCGGEREADQAFFEATGHKILYRDSKRFGERLEYLDVAGGTALREHFDLVLIEESS